MSISDKFFPSKCKISVEFVGEPTKSSNTLLIEYCKIFQREGTSKIAF